MEPLRDDEVRQAVRQALAEDVGAGDVTTAATVPEDASATALMRAREPLVVAGLALAEAAFRELSEKVRLSRHVVDGEQVDGGKILLRISRVN